MGPNYITALRIILGFGMLYSAYMGELYLFVGIYVLALITDVLDGFIARYMKKESEFGKRFDIIADNFIVISLLVGFYLLRKLVVIKYQWLFLALFSYYAVIQLTSFIKRRKLIFMRTYAANLAAILFPFVVLTLLFVEHRILIYSYIFLMIYALTEKIILTLNKSKKSIFKIKSTNLKIIFSIIVMAVFILFLIIPIGENLVCFPSKCISVEVRDTQESRALGLMYREHLDEDEGMLFIFDDAQRYNFWMKNMRISIDIIFLSEDKEIVHIYESVPPCEEEPCPTYAPAVPSLYVVETVAGFSEIYSLQEGDRVMFALDTPA